MFILCLKGLGFSVWVQGLEYTGDSCFPSSLSLSYEACFVLRADLGENGLHGCVMWACVCVCIYMYRCVYACMHVCMCIYIYGDSG